MTQSIKKGEKIVIMAGFQGCSTGSWHYFKKGQVVTANRDEHSSGVGAEGIVYWEPEGKSGTQILRPGDYKRAYSLDLTKPLSTIEGTPVKLIATQSVDPKWPLLVLEGNAVQPTKYNLNGEAKNGVQRRFLKNVEPAPVVQREKKLRGQKTVYINLYKDGGAGLAQDSRADADKASIRAERLGNKRIGVNKVVLQAGRFDD